MNYNELLNELSFDDLKNIISKYMNSKKNDNFNIFQVLNMREDSHSELLKWLLNTKNNNNKLQYYFLKNFIEYLSEMKDNKYREYIKISSDNFINNLAEHIKVPAKITCHFPDDKCKYIDVLFYSKQAKFVCIIENKLDANINTDNKGKTQLEYYHDYIEEEEKYKDYEKLFLFLSSYDLSKKQVKTVCKNDKLEKFLYKEIDISNKKFGYLLNKLNYKCIEHSDIILILYKTLIQLDINIEIQPSNEQKINILEDICKFIPRESKNKEIISDIIEAYKNNCDISIKTSNFNFAIGKFLNKYKQETINDILKQYIEYWEYHNDFVSGYSKIVPTGKKDKDGINYFININSALSKIKDQKFKDDYEKLDNELKDFIKINSPTKKKRSRKYIWQFI